MKKLLQVFTLLLLFSASNSYAQNYVWSKSIGSTGNEFGDAISTTDAAGNVYLAGYYEGIVDFNPGGGGYIMASVGSRDAYVAKYAPNGNFIWASTIGGADGDEYIKGIAVDASGYVFITGYFNSTSCDMDPSGVTQNIFSNGFDQIFVAKLDQSGGYTWAFDFGSTNHDQALDIAIDASSNVYVTGSFQGSVDFNPSGTTYLNAIGNKDVFVLVLDAFGGLVWVKPLSGSANETGTSIDIDGVGSVLIGGHFEGTVDFDPDVTTDNQSASGAIDAFVCKLDLAGNPVWARVIGSFTGDEYATSIVVDPTDNVYVGGYFDSNIDLDPGVGSATQGSAGSTDCFISKLNPSGNYVWGGVFGGSDGDMLKNLATDNTGAVYSIGEFGGLADFDMSGATSTMNVFGGGTPTDVFIAKTNAAGFFQWARQIGGSFPDVGNAITVDQSQNIYISGGYFGTVDFDPSVGGMLNYTSNGGSDIFLIKMDQCNVATNAGADMSLCLGNSVNLNASGAGSYLWNTAETTAGIIVSPVATATYVVTGTDFPGCSLNDTVVVTVNIPPAPINLGSDIDTCANSLTIGVTNDGVSNYQWTSVPSVLTSTNSQDAVFVLGNSTVEYRLSVTDPGTGCSVADTILVRLKETPDVSLTPNMNLCNFNPVTLSAGPDANTNYSWTSSPAGITATTHSISVVPGAATFYYVAATNTISGCTVNDTTRLYSNGSPSLTGGFGPYPSCFGDTLQLGSILTASGGTQPYTIDWWYGPAHLYGINPTYTVTASYTFSVSIVDANFCTQGFTTSFGVPMTGSSNTDLVGHVTTPLPADVDNGLVYAFRYQPGAAGYDTVGTAPLNANGEYNFVGMDNGTYLIKAIADEVSFPLLVPTYYGNAFQWDSSVVVNHGCIQTDTADIEMIELSVATGPGVVSGYILEGDSFGMGARYNGHIGPIYPCVPGGPLKGIDVKLGKNPGGGIQARVMTDSTGFYQFNNLPLLGYRIYVDIPNLPMDSTREIVLDSTNNISIQNNYFADSASVYINNDSASAVGIHASKKMYENNFTVFPNPAKDNLFIRFDLNKAGNVTIELTNALGQTVYEERIKNISSGTYSHQIEVSSLHVKAGVYFVSVLSDNKKHTQRLIVIE